MTIDRLIEQIRSKKNPCIAGIDPDWTKIPDCFKKASSPANAVSQWAQEIIDCLADIIPAIKPQMAFFEIFGADGFRAFEQTTSYAHHCGLLAIDDSKRNDIGNTAHAYAFAHLAPNGPINADFMTVSPFLGPDSLQPFVDAAQRWGKGIFVLAKPSNPGSAEISNSMHSSGKRLSNWLAEYIHQTGCNLRGSHGYSSIGAVVGATFPEETIALRQLMPNSFFLVPGFGAQGGNARDVISCFNTDGLGAVVSSSRSILYPHLHLEDFCGTKAVYLDLVRNQAIQMQREVQTALAIQK